MFPEPCHVQSSGYRFFDVDVCFPLPEARSWASGPLRRVVSVQKLPRMAHTPFKENMMGQVASMCCGGNFGWQLCCDSWQNRDLKWQVSECTSQWHEGAGSRLPLLVEWEVGDKGPAGITCGRKATIVTSQKLAHSCPAVICQHTTLDLLACPLKVAWLRTICESGLRSVRAEVRDSQPPYLVHIELMDVIWESGAIIPHQGWECKAKEFLFPFVLCCNQS